MVGCQEDAPTLEEHVTSVFTYDSASAVPLEATVVHESDSLGYPLYIETIGNYLVVNDLSREPTLHFLEPRTGKYLRGVGAEGAAPGEFGNVGAMRQIGSDTSDTFWMFDVGLRRWTYIDISDVLADTSALARRTISLDSGTHIYSPLWINDSTIVATSDHTERGRFVRINHQGEIEGMFGDPPPILGDVPPSVQNKAWRSPLEKHPDKPLIAAAGMFVDCLEIYDTDANRLAMTGGPDLFSMHFQIRDTEGRPRYMTNNDTRKGYLDVAVTDEHIYGVYSGGFHAKRSESVVGRYLHKFDWEGNFIEAYLLDHGVFGIATGDDRIYATTVYPIPMILSFPLP